MNSNHSLAEWLTKNCVMGIKFYMGMSKLHSMMIVHLQREFGNIHDPCAITVTPKSGGHVVC